MKETGIAVVSMEEEEMRLFQEVKETAEEYFGKMGEDDKDQQRMGTDGTCDWGYVEMSDVKEFWQMRHNVENDPNPNPWPEMSKRFYERCMEICRVCLGALGRGINAEPGVL